MDLQQVLNACVREGASDIMIKVGSPPKLRKDSDVIALKGTDKVTDEILNQWLQVMLPKHLRERLEKNGDVDFAYKDQGGQRYRVSLFRQRQKFGIVMRVISNYIKTMEELQLPDILKKFAYLKRGLVLVTGATGSGKTTSLAAILQKINLERATHIITIEDPIEYWFQDAMSLVNQREVGIDTQSFSRALRGALRQNPDVILVGELRDQETTETALMAAETGHLVFATLHTKDAVDSLTRLMSYFEPYKALTIRMTLSQVLNAVVSQRLVPRASGKGMVAAVEVLIANQFVKEVILKGDSFGPLYGAIKSGGEAYGMQSFDHALVALFEKSMISKETALEYASNRDDMHLQLSGIAT